MPVFEADNDDFILTLYNLNYGSSYATQANENVIENVIEISEEKVKKLMPEYSKKKLAKACEILKMISENPNISIDELRIALDVTDRTIARYIYLSVLYDYLHQKLYDYHVIQADETPVLVNHDDRPAGSKSYMWVYRSGYMYPEKQIVLYEYQRTRNASHPREFLKDFSGICVTEGYQVYHTLEKEKEDLTIAGCWVHGRRKFEEVLATIPAEGKKESVAYLVMKQIQAIYREEGKLKDLSSKERLTQRQVAIRPLVDALFAYLKQKKIRSW